MSGTPARTSTSAAATGRIAAERAGAVWRFARPHTLVGTTVSVVALYAIAAATSSGGGTFDLAATVIAAGCVNVAIVGLNQIEDVEIDRVNKPALPLPAGDLRPGTATAIVAATTVTPIGMALTQGILELAAVLSALVVGAAYSLPPLRLKRFPALAALSISSVRSVVINLGVFGHFAGGSLAEVPGVVWALTAFVVPFSLAIALLKDVPDIDGDRLFAIRTFSVRLGGGHVVTLAVALLVLAYVGMLVAPAVAALGADTAVWLAGHGVALGALAWSASRVRLADHSLIARFYMRIWGLFCFEYALAAAAVLVS